MIVKIVSIFETIISLFPIKCFTFIKFLFFLDFLKDGNDIADALMNDKLYVDVINETHNNNIVNNVNDIPNQDMINLPKFDNLNNFNDQCLSASDNSLGDQNSPQNLYSPDHVNFGAQNSPGSGSTDSGILSNNSNPSSPILSPDPNDYTDQLNNLGSLLGSVGLNLSGEDELSIQNQLLMKYFIQQQVQQALIQQQNKEKLQQLQQGAQLKQQQLLLLAQQQQLMQTNNIQANNIQANNIQAASNINNVNINNPMNQQNISQTAKTADSQLRKMLQQTKHNIINSLHGKKPKTCGFKFKSNSNNKTSKRKMTDNQSDEKAEKMLALSLSEESIQSVTTSTPSVVDTFEGNLPQEAATYTNLSSPEIKPVLLPESSLPAASTVSISIFPAVLSDEKQRCQM